MNQAVPEPGDRVVVIGGGTMGAGIAQVLLQADYMVTLIEADEGAGATAYERIRSGLLRAYKRHAAPAEQVDATLRRLTVSLGYDPDLRVGLVIESVPEIIELKRRILLLASQTWPGAVVATNTSSLSLAALSSAVDDPTRFVGMHFFNPVPLSDLVEVVTTPETTHPVVELAQGLARVLGKQSIVVRDSPGFATSRLGVLIGIEAIRMLEEKLASVEDIDTGMRLGYRMPMGPLELTDLVGLDVRLAIAEYLAESIGPRFEPPQLLRDMVSRGELGAKTGQGFYPWHNGKRV